MIEWFIYLWLAGVTALLAMLVYQSFVDTKDINSLRSILSDVGPEIANLRRNCTQNKEDNQHNHDHIQHIKSDIQDLKAKQQRRRKKKNEDN